ncbi:REEP1 protein, partial [Amia calva]|nr:REEP1 protein [Amia calva]
MKIVINGNPNLISSSCFFRLIFGTLYPAYSSYKAVKTKDVKEYVKWMMYWIIFALFTTAETITDIFLCWIPFYYELKIAFVVWLLSPYTKGSSVLYRKFVHPTLSSKEKEIDDYLCQAKDKSYDALVHFGRKGLNVAATAAVTAAAKGSSCRQAGQEGVAVVQAGEDQGLDEQLSRIVGEEGSDSAYVPQEESAGARQRGDVLSVAERRIEGDS